jgi:hypothetical protein
MVTRLATRLARLATPALAIASAVLAFALAGCSPVIGDHCAVSTDCSVQGNRVCDTSEPGGYCTLLGCTSNLCPDNAACVEFGASVPGCPYDDYQAPSRLGRSMCMKTCQKGSDCRESEGYTCVAASDQSPSTVILDTNKHESICMIAVTPSGSAAQPGAPVAAVCSSERPDAAPLDLGEGAGGEAGDDAAPAPDAAGDDAAAPAPDAAGDDAADAVTDDGLDGTLAPSSD